MSKSRISVLFLVALAQQFTAANALADPICPTPDQIKVGAPVPPGCTKPNPEAPTDLVPSISNLSVAAGKVTVAMSISNLGSASPPTTTRVELKVKGSGPVIHTQNVPTAAVQPSPALTLSAQAPMPPGSHVKTLEICVKADALEQTQESNENNNRVCKPLFSLLSPLTPGALP